MTLRGFLTLSCGIALALAGAQPAPAQELFHGTSLLSVTIGSARSTAARALGQGGYELAGGEYVDFAPWYDANGPDVTVLLLRRMSQELGLIWGVSTGERAQKHRIQPGLHLGVAWRRPISAIGAVSVTAVVPFFGRLRERACSADYGAIGGVQRVNCRLAASELPPEETLRYLLDLKGIEDARLTLRLSWQF